MGILIIFQRSLLTGVMLIPLSVASIPSLPSFRIADRPPSRHLSRKKHTSTEKLDVGYVQNSKEVWLATAE